MFVNTVSYCEMRLCFWFVCVIIVFLCFCELGYSCLVRVDKCF